MDKRNSYIFFETEHGDTVTDKLKLMLETRHNK